MGVVRLKLKSEVKVGITDRHMYHIYIFFFFQGDMPREEVFYRASPSLILLIFVFV